MFESQSSLSHPADQVKGSPGALWDLSDPEAPVRLRTVWLIQDWMSYSSGEEVTVEGGPGGAIIVKRFETVKDPLTVLIGKRPLFRKPLSSEKLEELSEDR